LKEYKFDGALQLSCNFIGGIPNGENMAYYSDGKTQAKQQFVNGILNGESVFYYPSGEIQTKQQYLNGDLIGFFIESIGFDDYDSPTGGNFCVEEGYYKDGERLVISKVCDY
jgi:antitoxin component YwqK of YwqJK toxin-antitoxin module